MSTPLVSCIVLTYQYAHFLERAIDSALAQDWPERALEVVVVDDGSTDGTPDVVARYGDRVRSIRRPNGGLVAAMNDGLAAVSGEYITLLSGDDTWPHDRLRRQVAAMDARPHVGLLFGDMEVIDAEDRLLASSFFRAYNVAPKRGDVLGPLLGRNFVSGGSAMVRGDLRDCYAPLPPEAVWEDWWLAVRIAERAAIDYLDEPVYRYRLHGENMNLGATGDRLLGLQRKEIPFRRWLLQGNVDLERVAAADVTMALGELQTEAGILADSDGDWMTSVLPVTDDDRRRAEAALRPGTANAAVAALAWDPFLLEAHDVLARACGRPSRVRPLATRRHVTVGLLPELLRDPSPLMGYRYTEADDATLVLYAPSIDQATGAAVASEMLEMLRIDADVLLVAEPRELAREALLLQRADAVVGARTEAACRSGRVVA